MKRVFLTGVTGFIGSHLARQLLKRGNSVAVVIRPGSSTRHCTDILPQVEVFTLDLMDSATVLQALTSFRPEVVLHLAWYAAPKRYWTAVENLSCTNMTLDLFQSACRAGCSKFIGAGSCAEYDWSYGFHSEGITPLRPATLYGACKKATFEILEAASREYQIGFTWLRFFYIYGPHEPAERLVPQVIRAFLLGEEANCTRGEQWRDYLHVEDLARAICDIVESNMSGAVNIASGEPIRIRHIVELLGSITGRSELIRLGALPERPNDPPLICADVRKLMTLGWRASYQLTEGLTQTVDWWRNEFESR